MNASDVSAGADDAVSIARCATVPSTRTPLHRSAAAAPAAAPRRSRILPLAHPLHQRRARRRQSASAKPQGAPPRRRISSKSMYDRLTFRLGARLLSCPSSRSRLRGATQVALTPASSRAPSTAAWRRIRPVRGCDRSERQDERRTSLAHARRLPAPSPAPSSTRKPVAPPRPKVDHPRRRRGPPRPGERLRGRVDLVVVAAGGEGRELGE